MELNRLVFLHIVFPNKGATDGGRLHPVENKGSIDYEGMKLVGQHKMSLNSTLI